MSKQRLSTPFRQTVSDGEIGFYRQASQRFIAALVVAVVATVNSGIASANQGMPKQDPNAAADPFTEAPGPEVKLVFTNVFPETGSIWVSICTKEQLAARETGGEFSCVRSAFIPAVEGAEAVFTDIPAGTYVATAFHDDNDNGRLDFDDRGIPFEATGNSANARGAYGPPTFDQMKFDLPAAGAGVEPLVFDIQLYKIEF